MGSHAGSLTARRFLLPRSINLRGCSPFWKGEQKTTIQREPVMSTLTSQSPHFYRRLRESLTGFSFYKKTNKKMLIIAAVAVLALVITMPSCGGSGSTGGSLNGTWVWQGRISGVPGTSTIAIEFSGNRFSQTTSNPSPLVKASCCLIN